jgi:hypothetical protein
MAAPANRRFEVQHTRELHGIHDVCDAAASRDQRGPFVNEPVVYLSGFVVMRVTRHEKLSGKSAREPRHRFSQRRMVDHRSLPYTKTDR